MRVCLPPPFFLSYCNHHFHSFGAKSASRVPNTGVVVGVPCRGYTYHDAFQTLRDSMPLSLARLPKTKQNKTCSTLFLVVDGERLTGVSTIMRTGGITASVFFLSLWDIAKSVASCVRLRRIMISGNGVRTINLPIHSIPPNRQYSNVWPFL